MCYSTTHTVAILRLLEDYSRTNYCLSAMEADNKNSDRKARRKEKRKRWMARKKEKAAEERTKDREARIEKRAQMLLDKKFAEERKQHKDEGTQFKRPFPDTETGTETKKKRKSNNDHQFKEIDDNHVVKTTSFLGSGTYGSCYLAFYRGLTVVTKELKVMLTKNESQNDAAKPTRLM